MRGSESDNIEGHVLLPKQPSLGPLFPVAIAAFLGVMLSEEFTWQSFANAISYLTLGVFALAGAVAAICVLFAAKRFKHVRVSASAVLMAVLAFCAGMTCGWACWRNWEIGLAEAQGMVQKGAVRLDLISDPSDKDYATVSVAKIPGTAITLRVAWPDETDTLSAGHSIIASGVLRAPEGDEAGRWNHQSAYAGMLKVSSFEDAGQAEGLAGLIAPFRDESFERIAQWGGQGAGLLAGVLLGNRTLYTGTELEHDFRTTGLAHLMAVSGSHLAVVAALVGFVIGKTPVRRGARGVLLGCFLVFYVALTCFAPSAIRSCVMCMAGLGASQFKRRRHVLNALALCVFAFVCLAPPVVFTLGFRLSVLAVFGLLTLSPLAATWLSRLLPGKLAALAEPAAATIAASVVTLPLTIPLFMQCPLITPLANLVAAPLVSLILGVGIPAVVIGAFAPALSALMLQLAGALASMCAFIVHVLADVPGACIPMQVDAAVLAVVLACSLIGLWACWPMPNAGTSALRRVAIGLAFTAPLAALLWAGVGGWQGILSVVLPHVSSSSQVVMVDVGQGDCMLIRSGDAAVLIDTGEEGDVLQAGLARNGVTKLDAVILTHKDADHTGALSSLAGVVPVGHVFIHKDLLSYDGEYKVLEAARWVTNGRGAEGICPGTKVEVGEFKLTVLAPEKGGESENEDSLIHLLEYDAGNDGSIQARALLTGDAEEEDIAEAVRNVGDVDFLKVGHHGSKGAVSAEELASLKPEFALIGVGAGNDYGHPAQETLQRLNNAGVKAYRTDLNGDIVVNCTAERLSVSVQK